MDELNAATDVAHQKGYKVSDGGLTGVPLSLMVWKDYWDRGLKNAADDFARRVFSPQSKASSIYDQLPSSAYPNRPFPPAASDIVNRYNWTVQAVSALKSTQVDFVNFHWYLDDAKGFGEVADYLRRVTAKPVISNEVGSGSDSPATVTALMQKALDEHMAYFNWFSEDINIKGSVATGGADAGEQAKSAKP
ncbi:MAG: hypothetical protein JF888_13635 [Candidatus Dormibacteraeota bacterium]|uniref:Asl1-like glycosyl hydrolase catalytic domain-containing protein n=1 Tax=Candidatus Dormiibacter inghamiae TaxID=3127013 RepID=A0A934KK18_9BACT|nr:hypothetical protein [Candidatus Dormibacteraeota bacterium]MBJ7606369.1 hypothetical protein [Candidatus Dormibacteraeota bacterium]